MPISFHAYGFNIFNMPNRHQIRQFHESYSEEDTDNSQAHLEIFTLVDRAYYAAERVKNCNASLQDFSLLLRVACIAGCLSQKTDDTEFFSKILPILGIVENYSLNPGQHAQDETIIKNLDIALSSCDKKIKSASDEEIKAAEQSISDFLAFSTSFNNTPPATARHKQNRSFRYSPFRK